MRVARLASVTALVLPALIAACGPKRLPAPAPSSTALVVLLPEPDTATPGRAIVSNATGSVELQTAHQSTRVTGQTAPSPAAAMDEAAIQQVFGGVLADLPQALQRFNLYFELESDQLTEESRAALPEILRAVGTRAAAEVTVIGHTDASGDAIANHELGLKRATAVRALLVANGLDPALVEVSSHGEGDPLISTPDGTPEPRNRRVEITIK